MCHAHHLTRGKLEQALDCQAELDRRLAVLLTAALLAACTAVPAHVLVQQDEQGAKRLQRRVALFPVGRSVLRFCWGTRTDSLPPPTLDRCTGRFVQQSLVVSEIN